MRMFVVGELSGCHFSYQINIIFQRYDLKIKMLCKNLKIILSLKNLIHPLWTPLAEKITLFPQLWSDFIAFKYCFIIFEEEVIHETIFIERSLKYENVQRASFSRISTVTFLWSRICFRGSISGSSGSFWTNPLLAELPMVITKIYTHFHWECYFLIKAKTFSAFSLVTDKFSANRLNVLACCRVVSRAKM